MIALTAAKAHLRVDFDDDDDEITAMIAAATDYLSSVGVDVMSSPPPAAVEHAVLMLVAHFYSNREDVGGKPEGVIDRLIAPYREDTL